MARRRDPAGRTPAQQAVREARAAARVVADGVAETVRLSQARGAAFAPPEPGVRSAHRRLTGLEWLVRKGRLAPAAAVAGLRYGQAYRRAKAEPGIPSTLNVKPGGASRTAGPSIAETLHHAEGTASARLRLDELRRRLQWQADLVAACDLVCGEERTPREAAGGEREGVRLEAVLKVALDLLAADPSEASLPRPR